MLRTESRPELRLRPATFLCDGLQGKKQSAIRQIGSSNKVLNSVQDDGALRVKQDFILIGVELTHCKPAPVASRQSVSEIQG